MFFCTCLVCCQLGHSPPLSMFSQRASVNPALCRSYYTHTHTMARLNSLSTHFLHKRTQSTESDGRTHTNTEHTHCNNTPIYTHNHIQPTSYTHIKETSMERLTQTVKHRHNSLTSTRTCNDRATVRKGRSSSTRSSFISHHHRNQTHSNKLYSSYDNRS